MAVTTPQQAHKMRLQAVIAGGAQIEGHGGLFFGSRAGGAGGANLAKGCVGVPEEVFLHIVSYFDDDDELVPVTQVCSAWRRSILGCAKLWRRLVDVDLAQTSSVEKVKTFASRSKGHLRYLHLGFNIDECAEDNHLSFASTLRGVLRAISMLDGASRLKTIRINFIDDMVDFDQAYNAIAILLQFVEFSAVNLEKLVLLTDLARFPAGAPFFHAMPQLKQLYILATPEAAYGMIPEALLKSHGPEDTSVALTRLELVGVSLKDVTFPEFPELKMLALYEVEVPNLYGLLSEVVDTLEDLRLCSITAKPPSDFMPIPLGGSTQDLPEKLSLPYLNTVWLGGGVRVISLWTTPTLDKSDFAIEALSLKNVSFHKSPQCHIEQTVDDDDCSVLEDDFFFSRDFNGNMKLNAEMLSTMFRFSPSITQLDVSSTNVTSAMLFSSLPSASHTLCKLRLGSQTDDSLIDRLHVLVPNLKYLDVSGRPYDVAKHPILPALTRLASRLRNGASAQLPRWLSAWKLELVVDKPPKDDKATQGEHSLQYQLRDLLLRLSPTQVTHLASSVEINSPPNGLTFHTVRQEIISLSNPPRGVDHRGNARKASKQAGGAEGPMAASQDVVNEAKKVMQKWQRKREEEQAIEWCTATNGVELRWSCEVGRRDW